MTTDELICDLKILLNTNKPDVVINAIDEVLKPYRSKSKTAGVKLILNPLELAGLEYMCQRCRNGDEAGFSFSGLMIINEKYKEALEASEDTDEDDE